MQSEMTDRSGLVVREVYGADAIEGFVVYFSSDLPR
jgi:hypothetical protein